MIVARHAIKATRGPAVQTGRHPLSLVDPPPAFPPFALDAAEVVNRPNGLPCIVCSGRCPSIDDLVGYVLVSTSLRQQLMFGGMHPKVRDGAIAPFSLFFKINKLAHHLHGVFAASMHVDVLVSRRDGSTEMFIFRYLSWKELMWPSSIQLEEQDQHGPQRTEAP